MTREATDSDADTLRAAFYSGLEPHVADFMRRAAERAAAQGSPLHLVGGAVRDLLLGRPVLDIDLVLKADALDFVDSLRESDLRVTRADAFRNARVDLPPEPGTSATGRHVDFVTARREMYPNPGQLPRVWPGTIEQDLTRRDFTVNALALPLDPPGDLLDPTNGLADLNAAIIRVLHDRSFRDDPTRIFRATRFEQRFDFMIERHTLNLIRNALRKGMVDALTPDRIRHELARTLREVDPTKQLRRLAELEVLQAIEPGMIWDQRSEREFAAVAAQDAASSADKVTRTLALLLYRLTPEERQRAGERLGLEKDTRRLVEDLAQMEQAREKLLGGQVKPSDMDRILSPLGANAVALATAAWSGTPAGDVLANRRDAPPPRQQITGDDLKRIGLQPGPTFRDVLAAVRAAVVDGEIAGREQELDFVRRWAAQHGLQLNPEHEE